MFSASEIFDLAVRIEENGERFYRQAVGQVSNPVLQAMLGKMADEEMSHREWFLKMKRSEIVQEQDFLLRTVSGMLLQDAIDDHGFSLEEVDFNSIPDEASVLQVAIGFEEDSIAFYEILGAFVQDEETRRHLFVIIEEEKRHIELLEAQMRHLNK